MSPPRHLTNEDPFPEKTPGKVRLYYMQYCPFALRARLMLTQKGVDFETININLKNKPAWFLEKFPSGTVPVIEIDDKILGESLVITEYVDEVYSEPGHQLVPSDPYERAKQRVLITNLFPKVIAAVYKRLYNKDDTWKESILKQLGALEEILSERKFFSGDKFGYADYMIWPWMRYFGPHCIDDVPCGDYPNFERWLEDAKKDPVIEKCATAPEVLGKFAEGYQTLNFIHDLE